MEKLHCCNSMKCLFLLDIRRTMSSRFYGGGVMAGSTMFTPEEALRLLLEGNRRFVDGESCSPNSDTGRRREIVSGQKPFATVLTCSDSRVPPELIFDRGFGDIFVVRVAGNILSGDVMASILYAVNHMKCPIVVVLGHESCGAVTEALKLAEHAMPMEEEVAGFLRKLQHNMPETISCRLSLDDPVDAGARENVKTVTDMLMRHRDVAPVVEDGGCRIVPAFYSLSTGEVEWL